MQVELISYLLTPLHPTLDYFGSSEFSDREEDWCYEGPYEKGSSSPTCYNTNTDDGQPTSTNFSLSPTDVDQLVKSMTEYMLARVKIKWKNEY